MIGRTPHPTTCGNEVVGRWGWRARCLFIFLFFLLLLFFSSRFGGVRCPLNDGWSVTDVMFVSPGIRCIFSCAREHSGRKSAQGV